MNRTNNNNKNQKKKKTNSKKLYNYDEEVKEKNRRSSKKTKKKKNHSSIGSFIGKFLLIIFFLLVIFAGVFYANVQKNGGGLQGVLCTIFGQSVEDLSELESINVLLLGVSEDIDVELTDTIILCNYNPQNQTASMLSIPRDTFIGKNKTSAKGSDKINSLYSKGVEKTISAVEEITNVDIDYYVVVNTEALIKIVDIIGGVEFDVPIDMEYDDPTQDLHINLKAGIQTIDGEKAEQLLRFRHNNDGTSYPTEYGDNDYGRMRTQREFITETIKQTVNIKNIFKIGKIIRTIFDNVETNMEKEDIYSYVPTLATFNMDNIKSDQLPGTSEKCNGLWFFLYSKSQTKTVLEELGF